MLDEELVGAFLCEPPATVGHTLVVPRVHRRDIFELEPAESAAAWEAARRIAFAARDGLGAVAVNLRQNSGARSDQDVFHFHLHVVPRYDDDTVQPGCVWGSPSWVEPPAGEHRRAAEALRRRLAAVR